jgi:hypothetical protein
MVFKAKVLKCFEMLFKKVVLWHVFERSISIVFSSQLFPGPYVPSVVCFAAASKVYVVSLRYRNCMLRRTLLRFAMQ